MFTHIPCWNLPTAHRILASKGVTDRMEVQPSYRAMLRLASSA
jgi:fatty acid desaturase